MALSRNTRKKTPYRVIYKQSPPKDPKRWKKILKIVFFWLVFFLFITVLFIINWPLIHTTMQNALKPTWSKPQSEVNNADEVIAPLPDILEEEPLLSLEDALDSLFLAQGLGPLESRETTPNGTANEFPAQPASATVNLPAPPVSAQASLLVQEDPQPGSSLSGESSASSPSRQAPIVTRDRPLYFIELDRGGAILRSKVTRAVSSSDAPLFDVLQALLTGPTPEEQRQGLRSLIPQGTKIVSITVRRETAYINISEEFQYNTFGVEGYAAQLHQIVWTATEFPNIKDVQILIDGRRLDYLGEGIWIGSPLSRDMF